MKFRQKREVGRDISFADLEKQFDAIFIGVGLGETWDLKLPGEDLAGVYGAIEFIEKTKVQPFHEVEIGRRVACIGAGNTAIDVVTAARRLGAETVYLIYRRGEPEMPAFAYEYRARQAGCGRFSLADAAGARPRARTAWSRASNACARSLARRTRKGRRTPVPVAGHRIHARCGHGRARGGAEAGDGIPARREGVWNSTRTARCKINDRHQTGNPKYFAGGDCTNGGKEVVDAVAEGMAAARGLDAWLGSPARAIEARACATRSLVTFLTTRGEQMADLTVKFAGITSPNPFWLASGPPTNTGGQVMRAFDAGWGGAVWKTIGEPIVNTSSRYGSDRSERRRR